MHSMATVGIPVQYNVPISLSWAYSHVQCQHGERSGDSSRGLWRVLHATPAQSS